MTTKQIDYCIELAHTLNFSRAAENMFVSQPTLTYQIKLLEEEVGFPIFERSGKGAALTPAGAQFVSFLAGMREDLKRAIEQGQNFSATYRDSISISLMVRQAIYFLPEAIRLFAETNGDVQFSRRPYGFLRKQTATFSSRLYSSMKTESDPFCEMKSISCLH